MDTIDGRTYCAGLYELYRAEPNDTNYALATNELTLRIAKCKDAISTARNAITKQTYRQQYYEKLWNDITTLHDTNGVLTIVKNSIAQESLTDDELMTIIEGMDKTDYTKTTSVSVRYLDLKQLVEIAILTKSKYPAYTLKKIIQDGQRISLPPQSCYVLSYGTEYGDQLDFRYQCTS